MRQRGYIQQAFRACAGFAKGSTIAMTIAFALLLFQNCSGFGTSTSSGHSRGLSSVLSTSSSGSIGAPFLVIDSGAHGFTYSYGASVILAEGRYHAYFCSAGTGVDDWDYNRYATSSDLVRWGDPVNIMQPSRRERANCDPSVIRFDAGDGPYYYMVYSGNIYDVQTVNFLARSSTPGGPFLRYTDRGTWEERPADPRVVNWPHEPRSETSGAYGAGQPSLIVKDGIVHQWYTDTTVPGDELPRQYLVTSRDLINWSPKQATNVRAGSIDVKYDSVSKRFVMIELLGYHAPDSRLGLRTSSDGINWSEPDIICDTNCFPDWAHNPGLSGDDQGHLIPGGDILITYGAPPGLSPQYNNDCRVAPGSCWGFWSLYGQLFRLSEPSSPPAQTESSTSFRMADLSWFLSCYQNPICNDARNTPNCALTEKPPARSTSFVDEYVAYLKGFELLSQ